MVSAAYSRKQQNRSCSQQSLLFLGVEHRHALSWD